MGLGLTNPNPNPGPNPNRLDPIAAHPLDEAKAATLLGRLNQMSIAQNEW